MNKIFGYILIALLVLFSFFNLAGLVYNTSVTFEQKPYNQLTTTQKLLIKVHVLITWIGIVVAVYNIITHRQALTSFIKSYSP